MAEGKLPRLVGDHLLTTELEADALGRIYRARTGRPGEAENDFVLVRRLEVDGFGAEALADGVDGLGQLLPHLKGPGLFRDSSVFEADGAIHLISEYAAGHSLGRVLEKTFDEQFPVAIDQCLSVMDRIVSAIDAAYQVRFQEKRVQHLFLVPSLVWLTDEGEVKVGGFGIGAGLLGKARSGALADAFSRYLAPEVRAEGEAGKNADVYTACAIFWELLTCTPVPEKPTVASIGEAVVAHDGEPIPADLRAVLEKGLAADPEMRFGTPADLKKELGKILYSGAYTPTTFNLAFFMNNLFRSEFEKDARNREVEAGLNFEDFRLKPDPKPKPVAAAGAAPAAAPKTAPSAPTFGGGEEPEKSKSGLFAIVAVVIVIAGGVGGFLALRGGGEEAEPAAQEEAAPVQPAPQQPQEETDPVKIQEEIQRRVAEEMAKLQEQAQAERDEMTRNLQEERLATLRKQEEEYLRKIEEAKKAAEEATRKAAQPQSPGGAKATPGAAGKGTADAAADGETKPVFDAEASKAAEEAEAAQKQLEESLAAPIPASQPETKAEVKEGDLVDFGQLDTQPLKIREVAPVYPRVAKKRRSEGLVILRILVDEKGEVGEVKVLREPKDTLLTRAAVDAVEEYRYEPGLKSGKKVKTWVTETIRFQL